MAEEINRIIQVMTGSGAAFYRIITQKTVGKKKYKITISVEEIEGNF